MKPRFPTNSVVVIPALNEALCVGETVQTWLSFGAGRVRVVDNGSSDDTATVAAQAGAEVISEPGRGYGAAAWAALQNWPTGMEWVLFSSADGSDRLTLAEAVEWQKALDSSADLVIGDRTSLAESRQCLKLVQRFGNWIICQGVWLGWAERFKDMGSLRLVRQRSLVGLGINDRGFGWNVEMQVRAIEQGWQIVELPVRYYRRTAGESKISGNVAGTVRAGLAIARTLGMLWKFRRRKGQAASSPMPAA
ncbi:MAG: glycosyltransferase family 2 protein [Verrucomicrobia subdivision 3 bacterium]|nr:glycosyltransferase family 2 protein [Limisphaerales bacterium]